MWCFSMYGKMQKSGLPEIIPRLPGASTLCFPIWKLLLVRCAGGLQWPILVPSGFTAGPLYCDGLMAAARLVS